MKYLGIFLNYNDYNQETVSRFNVNKTIVIGIFTC